jgi:hypothetical protein
LNQVSAGSLRQSDTNSSHAPFHSFNPRRRLRRLAGWLSNRKHNRRPQKILHGAVPAFPENLLQLPVFIVRQTEVQSILESSLVITGHFRRQSGESSFGFCCAPDSVLLRFPAFAVFLLPVTTESRKLHTLDSSLLVCHGSISFTSSFSPKAFKSTSAVFMDGDTLFL